ncbi:Kinesin-like protein KIF23 [Trichoplax sp. H2]|nr:Kinesin-like protein KIF23 [Trichoplax sp. H2]|eukprot:RDD46621.1 Kinesin-like protein KIF23 [Trichoplax sp. H2]
MSLRANGKTPKKARNEQDPIEVYCRIRPLPKDRTQSCAQAVSQTEVRLIPTQYHCGNKYFYDILPQGCNAAKMNHATETSHFFEHVFDRGANQPDVFNRIALPLVENFIHGKNGLIFAYGITCSGKTFTMNGTSSDIGILPRCLDVIFNSIGSFMAPQSTFIPDKVNSFEICNIKQDRKSANEKKPSSIRVNTLKNQADFGRDIKRIYDDTKITNADEDNVYSVFVSLVEIYNNYVYDLLEEPSNDINKSKLPNSKILREDLNHNMFVSNCTEVEVRSADEAYALLLKGQQRRRVAYTRLNHESSRSHSIFNIRLVQAPLDVTGLDLIRDKNRMAVSQLSLVDLAGSERTIRTNSDGDRLREAGNINSSLMVLRKCMEILRDNQAKGSYTMVPYRDSKLTHLFKSFFEGEGKARLIVCLNPLADDYDESIHVMKFAEVTKEVVVTRAKEIDIAEGLMPGRRKVADAVAERGFTDESGDEIALTLGPPFPNYLLSSADDEKILSILMKFLKDRFTNRQLLNNERKRKQQLFRNELIRVEGEYNAMSKNLNEFKAEVSNKDREVQSLERKLKNASEKIELLQKNIEGFETSNRELELQLIEHRRMVEDEKQERTKLKEAIRGAVFQERDKWERECDKRVKASQLQMKSKLWETDEKLRLLKEIVESTPTKRKSVGVNVLSSIDKLEEKETTMAKAFLSCHEHVDKRVKASQLQMKSKLWETDEKLRLLKEIVESTPTKRKSVGVNVLSSIDKLEEKERKRKSSESSADVDENSISITRKSVRLAGRTPVMKRSNRA